VPRVRYSLRTLLLVTIVVGCVAGWLVRRHFWERAGREIRASLRSGTTKRLDFNLWLRPDLVEVTDATGAAPLHTVARRDDCAVALMLIEAGADVNLRDRTDRRATPLHWAAGWGSVRAARLLIDRGARVDATDERGMTPLHYAIERDHAEMAGLLMMKGADAEAPGEAGVTPFALALRCDSSTMIELITANARSRRE